MAARGARPEWAGRLGLLPLTGDVEKAVHAQLGSA
jgi:hypothetical protein